jgi:hypothetical protein
LDQKKKLIATTGHAEVAGTARGGPKRLAQLQDRIATQDRCHRHPSRGVIAAPFETVSIHP